MSQVADHRRRVRLWGRFSIGDLFLFIFGIALGLGFYRLEHVRWPDALLACCAGWIAAGMAQEAGQAWSRRRGACGVSAEMRWGLAIEYIQPLAVIGLLAFASVMELIRRLRPEMPEGEFADDWAATTINLSLFFLAVICAYGSPSRMPSDVTSASRQVWKWGVEVVALAVGAAWLSFILMDAVMVPALVHIAIRGVQLAQPLRLSGKPFYPANLNDELMEPFLARGIAASVLLLSAAVCGLLLARHWNRGGLRLTLSFAAGACLTAVAILVWWCATSGYPTLSPLLAAQTGKQPWSNVVAGIGLILSAGFAAAVRLASKPQVAGLSTAERLPRRGLHTTPCVALMFLVAAIAGGIPSWWISATLIPSSPTAWTWAVQLFEYWLSAPCMLLRLAAIIVVGQFLIRQWRGLDVTPELRAINPLKFVSIWLLASLIFVLAVPVGAWFGFILALNPSQF